MNAQVWAPGPEKSELTRSLAESERKTWVRLVALTELSPTMFHAQLRALRRGRPGAPAAQFRRARLLGRVSPWLGGWLLTVIVTAQVLALTLLALTRLPASHRDAVSI